MVDEELLMKGWFEQLFCATWQYLLFKYCYEFKVMVFIVQKDQMLTKSH